MSVLKQGSSGPEVTALQTKLKQLGFDPNGVDGNFGPGTTSALIAFQKSKGLLAELTGRTNYSSFTQFIGDDCVDNPDLVATLYPLASAGFFFNSNNIFAVCDRGADDATVLAVSKRVNGDPPHAVPERTKYFREFINALT